MRNWLLSLFGSSASAWSRRGDAALQGGRLGRALELYDRALAVDPSLARAWAGRGIVRTRLGGDGIPDLRRSVELDPENAWSAVILGWALGLAGDRDDALSALARAEKRDPDLAVVRERRAWIHQSWGEDGAAIEVLSVLLARFPERNDLRASRAALLAREGRASEALADCERMDAGGPRTLASLLARGQVLLEIGDLEGARGSAERALNLDPRDSEAGRLAAQVCFLREDVEAAGLALSRALPSGWGRYARGVAGWILGRWDDAIGDFQEAVERAEADRVLRDYGELRIWMTSRRRPPDPGADARWRDYQRSRRTGTHDTWFPALAGFMGGLGGEDELLSAASTAPGRLKREREAQAHFHIGLRRKERGDLAGAAEAQRRCVELDARGYFEHIMARAELRALSAG